MNKLGNNTKTAKADKLGWENRILHLSPVKKAFKVFMSHKEEVGKLGEKRLGKELSNLEIEQALRSFNTCRFAGACAQYCLDSSGRGKFSNVQQARSAKTLHKAMDSESFDSELIHEIKREAKKHGNLAIRLNGTSDLDWLNVIKACPSVQFYDYTKSRLRIEQFIRGELPSNYYLTYSYDRARDKRVGGLTPFLRKGVKIAIMQGDYNNLPESLKGWPVIDGDDHDLRFLDKKIKGGAFVILQEKGEAKNE